MQQTLNKQTISAKAIATNLTVADGSLDDDYYDDYDYYFYYGDDDDDEEDDDS